MDYKKDLRNNEQRSVSSSGCTLQRVMPGGSNLANEQHIIGKVPSNCNIGGFAAYMSEVFDGDIVVDVGFNYNPTYFLSDATISSGNLVTNDKTLTKNNFIGAGSGLDIVCTIKSGNTGDKGVFKFVVDYNEFNTKAGKYTY